MYIWYVVSVVFGKYKPFISSMDFIGTTLVEATVSLQSNGINVTLNRIHVNFFKCNFLGGCHLLHT